MVKTIKGAHASKAMLKILQARLQQYINWELTDIQVGYRKGRGSRYQIANTCWITEKAREFHNKLWKILIEMGIPNYLMCLLRNLYAGQKATIRTGHGTIDWFQIRKRVRQHCILSSCVFNLNAECIMGNARLDEAQAGIKIPGRNINNLRYADDTTLWQKVKRK